MPVGPLPDLDTLDAAALREMIVKQHAQISSHNAELERLRLVIARLQRLQFGRKSEKIERQLEQLELQLEDLEARSAEERQQTENELPPAAADVFAAAARKPARRPLPEHFPAAKVSRLPGRRFQGPIFLQQHPRPLPLSAPPHRRRNRR
jgi:transposase